MVVSIHCQCLGLGFDGHCLRLVLLKLGLLSFVLCPETKTVHDISDDWQDASLKTRCQLGLPSIVDVQRLCDLISGEVRYTGWMLSDNIQPV